MRGKVGLFARKISSYFQLSHALTLSLVSPLLPCPSAFLHALTRSRSPSHFFRELPLDKPA
ncbi:MAG: hypothetical protein BRC43_00295 [Cyanobacteria bacterium QS_3_48_167]|nr:MAG: hypothetical protein BRC43_00295 [Cyanobacteria bacterium QS_3_48_167]